MRAGADWIGRAVWICLALMAGYPPGTPPLEWDVCYPEESDALLMVSQDSAKRGSPSSLDRRLPMCAPG